jgi:hypothetical protein
LQVFIEVDLERVVKQVGCDHEPAEGGQCHDLVGLEASGQTAE